MSREQEAARAAQRYRERIGAAHIGRQDLVMCDKVALGEGQQARILVAYNALNGEPTAEQIKSFVWASFGGKVAPLIDTARLHKHDQCVDMLVELLRPTAALDESKKMTQVIKDASFVDPEGKIWDVRTADDGTKYLARRSDDDLDAILAERMKFLNRTATLPKLHTLKEAGYATASPGDTVEFYRGTALARGKITAMGNDNTVTVDVGGTVVKIPRESIHRVVQHSEVFEREKRQSLQSYFSKYLGDELASKLVNLPEAPK
jgi:ribosomal protein L27